MDIIKIFFDGGSRQNPGASAGAAIIKIEPVITVTKFLPNATNNEAEYTGMIIGLEKALELGLKKVEVKGDSQLVINQVNGVYKCNASNLLHLYTKARSLVSEFQVCDLSYIPRAQNIEADAAVNAEIDQNTGGKKASVVELVKSLPLQEPSGKAAEKIKSLLQKGEKAEFKDFQYLKSGRDSWTNKKLTELLEVVPTQVLDAIDIIWNNCNDKNKASVLRWYMRGLPLKLAIRKVKVDLQITEKVKKAR